MSGESFLRVTVNPRLEFGVPLKQVCSQELLHPGLKELFLKAYISAVGEDHDNEERDNGKLKSFRVLKALRAGPKGQGSVAERISLKLKLESGKWIVAAQTPSGAPLWLIRHFFGLLPQPLLDESNWEMIAIICGIYSWLKRENCVDEILDKIVTNLKALPIENYSMLEALVLLIRNLGIAKTLINGSVMLNRKVIEALSRYFTAAIFSRPYRPGLHTMLDKLHEPLLVFLAEHWLEVKESYGDCGVSRYHSNKCQLRYEFVSPDGEVSSAEWRTPNTENITNDKIDIDLSENSVRKAVQRSTASSRTNYASKNPENDERESRTQNDVLPAANTRKMKIESANALTALRAPKGVYFNSENEKSRDASAANDHKRSSEDPKKNLCNSLLLFRSNGNFDRRYVELDVKKENWCECPLPQTRGTTFKDKTNVNSNCNSEMQKLVFRHGHRGDIAINGTSQTAKVNSESLKDKMKKANGTQTFECEFPEVICCSTDGIETRQSEVLQPKVKMAEDNSDDMKRKRDDDNTLAVTGIRRLNFIKLSDKINEKRAIIPLTRSTAMLIKNFASFDQRIICLATRKHVSNCKVDSRNIISDLAKVENINNKIIEAVGNPSIKPQMNDQSFVSLKVDEPNVKTLTNPLKEVNKKRDRQKKHSDDNDFIFELKKKIQARS